MMTAGGPVAPPAVLRHLADGCRQTYELFATLFSVGQDVDFLALLEDNRANRRYYERVAALGGTRAGDLQFRSADVLLRAAMSPRSLDRLHRRRHRRSAGTGHPVEVDARRTPA